MDRQDTEAVIVWHEHCVYRSCQINEIIPHCAKNNLYLSIKTEPVPVGAFLTVYTRTEARDIPFHRLLL